MTASATKMTLDQLSVLTGYKFLQHNVFWPGPELMAQRQQGLSFSITNRPMAKVKRELKLLYQQAALSGERKQWILYSNSRVRLERCQESICSFLDDNGYPGDTVLITGPLSREQKFHYTNLFLNPTVAAEVSDAFDAVGALLTRPLGGAGLDGIYIHLVMSLDFPTNLLSLIQEKDQS